MKLNALHPVRNRTTDSPNFAYEPPKFKLEHTIFSKKYGRIRLRPIRVNDEDRMVEFHEGLSEESVYLRFFEHITLDARTLHARLVKVCANTADSFGIVAERHATAAHPTEILAVGRLTTTSDPEAADFALLVSDEAQNSNLSLDLLRRLIEVAKAFRFQRLTGELLVADSDGLKMCRDLGFTLHTIPEDGLVRVTYTL
jgi:acetyltransferase